MVKLDGNQNGALDILVVSQAVQAKGFADAETALDAAFGDITEQNHPWAAATQEKVGDDAALENALKNPDASTIIVELTDDVTYDVAAWAANGMGGEKTDLIVINGNGNTITFNQTNSDWNNIVTNGAKLVINNAKLTNSGYNNGPWNRHDLNFACEVELNNVVSDKAIALKAGAALKNVTIDDANTSDTYALWIQPNGQTVTLDDCVIDMIDCTDGRGIKIDEQYVGAPEKVTLKVSDTVFKTEEKSAILVKSVAGADITLDNIDIYGVKADPVNAVWVDEASAAYADLVTVTGGKKAVEGETKVVSAANSAAVDEAIKGGADVVVLEAGNYIIPDSAKGKELTIVGTGDTVIAAQDDGGAEGDCDYSLDGSTVTFENVTITTSATYFPGYARVKGTYNNCTINGVWTLYDDSTFNNCTFNVSGDVYNVWTWGAKNATFNNCTFNNDGKAVLLYGAVDTKLTMNDCVFNDKGGLTDLKAAIEIGNDYGRSYKLIVNNATVNGYEINDKGINTGSTLWANKNSMPQTKLNVVVDGVDVY